MLGATPRGAYGHTLDSRLRGNDERDGGMAGEGDWRGGGLDAAQAAMTRRGRAQHVAPLRLGS